MGTPIVNPFPGLRPFDERFTSLFFGRTKQYEALLKGLNANRFLAILGVSGSGKSSLVLAGLIPQIRKGILSGPRSNWRIAVFRPGDKPVDSLALELSKKTALGNENLAERLRDGSLGLRKVLQDLDKDSNLLLVIDQFEELFRYKDLDETDENRGKGVDDASEFVRMILDARTENYLYVVLTMRSDYIGDCAQFRDLPECINAGQYLIPRLTIEEQKQIIQRPVWALQAKISTVLVDKLIRDVGSEPQHLPVLQHALMRIWEDWAKTPAKELDDTNYQAIGGLQEALNRHADEVYAGLPSDEHRWIAKRIFQRITLKDRTKRVTRRPAKLEAIYSITYAAKLERQRMVQDVIARYREEGCNFLAPSDQGDLIDISHESLCELWQRLKKWVSDESDSALHYSLISESAELYEKKSKGLADEVELKYITQNYHPGDTSFRDGWTREWCDRYNKRYDVVIDYLKKSQDEVDRRLAQERADADKREDLLKKQAADAAQLAEERTKRAENEAELAKNAALLADEQAKNAQKESALAKNAAVLAEQKADLANKAAQLAKANSARFRNWFLLAACLLLLVTLLMVLWPLLRLHRHANADEVAQQFKGLKLQQGSNSLEKSALFAIASRRTLPVNDNGDVSDWEEFDRIKKPAVGSTTSLPKIYGLSFVSGGQFLIATGENSIPLVLNRTSLNSPTQTGLLPACSVAVTTRGKYAVSRCAPQSGQDNTYVYTLYHIGLDGSGNRGQVVSISSHDPIIWIEESENKDRIVGLELPSRPSADPGHLFVLDEAGKNLKTWPLKASPLSATLSREGDFLAIYEPNDSIDLFDLSTGKTVHNFPKVSGAMAFDTAGHLFLGGTDGLLHKWDLRTENEEVFGSLGSIGKITKLAYSDGPPGLKSGLLAIASGDGPVLIEVCAADGSELLWTTRFDSGVDQMKFSSHGSLLALSLGDNTARIREALDGSEIIRASHPRSDSSQGSDGHRKDESNISAMTFSPDDQQLFFGARDGVVGKITIGDLTRRKDKLLPCIVSAAAVASNNVIAQCAKSDTPQAKSDTPQARKLFSFSPPPPAVPGRDSHVCVFDFQETKICDRYLGTVEDCTLTIASDTKPQNPSAAYFCGTTTKIHVFLDGRFWPMDFHQFLPDLKNNQNLSRSDPNLRPPPPTATSLSFSGDGKELAVGISTGRVMVFRIDGAADVGKAPMLECQVKSQDVNAYAPAPCLLEPGGGEEYPPSISALSMGPNAEKLAIGSSTGDLWVVSPSNAKQPSHKAMKLNSRGYRVNALALSPDNNKIGYGIGNTAGLVMVDGRNVYSVRNLSAVQALAFSKDGKKFASLGGTVQVFAADRPLTEQFDAIVDASRRVPDAEASITWGDEGQTPTRVYDLRFINQSLQLAAQEKRVDSIPDPRSRSLLLTTHDLDINEARYQRICEQLSADQFGSDRSGDRTLLDLFKSSCHNVEETKRDKR